MTDLPVRGAPTADVVVPFGTLLCTPTIGFTGPPRAPFPIRIPNDPSLVSVELTAQGGTVMADRSLRPSNALDPVIGDL